MPRVSVIAVLAMVLLLVVPPGVAGAATPSNDNFANHSPLEFITSGSNAGATVEGGEDTAGVQETVWFSHYESHYSGEIELILTPTSGDGTVRVQFGDTIGGFYDVGGYNTADDPKMMFSPAAGFTFRIQIGGDSLSATPMSGGFTLTMRRVQDWSGTVTASEGGAPLTDVCVKGFAYHPTPPYSEFSAINGTDGSGGFAFTTRFFTSSTPTGSIGSVKAYDCNAPSYNTVFGPVTVSRYFFVTKPVVDFRTTDTLDELDIAMVGHATVHGQINGYPEDEAPCAQIYHVNSEGNRTTASTKVSSVGYFKFPDLITDSGVGDADVGDGTLVMDECVSPVPGAWPYPEVFLGNASSFANADQLDLDPGELQRHDFPFPADVPDLVSYFPGPDGNGKGRLWITDTLTGTQSLATKFGTPSGWQTHLVGDLDGDETSSMYSYFPGPDGNGKGRWWTTDLDTGAQKLLTTFGTPSGWQTHLTADMDGDGTDELISYFPGNGSWWRTTVGSGGAAAQTNFTNFGTKTGWQTHRVADMDGDGRQEILSYFPGNGSWWQTSIAPNGTAKQVKLTTYGTTTGWQEHLVADVTGDDTPELLSYHSASGRWWQTDTSGATAKQTKLTTYGSGDGLGSASWATHLVSDQDLNGKSELISFDSKTGRWWSTATNGTTAQPRTILTTYGTKTGWQTHLLAPTG